MEQKRSKQNATKLSALLFKHKEQLKAEILKKRALLDKDLQIEVQEELKRDLKIKKEKDVMQAVQATAVAAPPAPVAAAPPAPPPSPLPCTQPAAPRPPVHAYLTCSFPEEEAGRGERLRLKVQEEENDLYYLKGN